MYSYYSWNISITFCVLAVIFLFIIRCWFPKFKLLSDIIWYCYGNQILKIVWRYQKLIYRLRKLDFDIKFLNTWWLFCYIYSIYNIINTFTIFWCLSTVAKFPFTKRTDIKDNHSEKAPSNNTPALTKRMNMNICR